MIVTVTMMMTCINSKGRDIIVASLIVRSCMEECGDSGIGWVGKGWMTEMSK